MAALSLGASDAIAKPASGDLGQQFADQLLMRIRRLAAAGRYRAADRAPIVHRPVPQGFRLERIGIGASTGGIHALADLLERCRENPQRPFSSPSICLPPSYPIMPGRLPGCLTFRFRSRAKARLAAPRPYPHLPALAEASLSLLAGWRHGAGGARTI